MNKKSVHDTTFDTEKYNDELSAPPQEKKGEHVNTNDLKGDAAKREKKQPLITRMIKVIKAEKKVLH